VLVCVRNDVCGSRMSVSLTLFPPAKLNLFLHIIGRRADGYHLLQTVFELIDWCDQLTLSVREDGQITRSAGAAGVIEADDLVVRAARLMQSETNSRFGADLALIKLIPQGAGLGGGSADAAACLLGLNQLWDLRLPLAELMQLGLQLGADVPVFLAQQPAWAEGIGEQLTTLAFTDRQYLVVFPGEFVATAPMFNHSELQRDCVPLRLNDYQAGAAVSNVFAPLVYAQAPQVAAAAAWLQPRFGHVRMSGSGSALFVQIDDIAGVQSLMRGAPSGWQWRCVHSIANWFDNRSV